MAPPLPSDLQRQLLVALLETWRSFNYDHFRNAMRPPALAIVQRDSFLGRWTAQTRTIELSLALVTEQPWAVVIEVLKHEMAHQYVSEVLGENDETAHGPAFRKVCERLNIDARAAGLPTGDELPEDARRALERVRKLLALAQSDNQHEAEAAASAAQRVMLKHNLQQPSETRRYSFRQLGRITGRVTDWERRLAGLLTSHFFVDAVWIPAFRLSDGLHGSVLEVLGTPANLDVAEYVHGFLSDAAERLWQAHKRTRGIRGNRDRRVFYSGVMTGFSAKLRRQAEQHHAEGLVWVPDAGRDDYVRQRYPRLQTVSRGGARLGSAFGEGRRAGESLVLHRGMQQGSSGGTRLLTS